MKKMKVAIIGTGNIGTDLLMKIIKSEFLECCLFTGRNPESDGIKRAEDIGIKVSCDSIKAIEDDPGCCDIVFDATSAKVHIYNAPILKRLGKYTIDLTPSQIGKMCVPVINLKECLSEDNVNLITCGGQATIPIAYAIRKVHPEIEYIEIVASIASKSAGRGTRANIDEFTQTTREALTIFTGVPKAKAIINLNPAEPPVIMHNTIYAKIDNPRIDEILTEVHLIVKKIQQYVPGYRIVLEPVAEGGRVTTMIEVVGVADFLPKYAGNLDIITCAAVNIAEEYAKKKRLMEGV
ncbi:acetaldehyde dehydrogenase (acetylating) [Clostridium sp.]|jgi:acetaldehyde dehydrogenase (acetylating)|uniref:acetaldehyde dehydrogenase (acetylating) n=1 Tax=Clostridium sp. TaxID=1506 RepID=UPI003EEDEC48